VIPADIVGVPIPVDTLAKAVGRHPRYRVQKLIEPMVRFEPHHRSTSEFTIAVVDVETTGLDWNEDAIIELAIQTIYVDAHGRIVEVGRCESWFEDPGVPIPPRITEITRITDEMVKGKRIHDGPAATMLMMADGILSHNAGFDRPFVEKRLELAGHPWICSLMDIDWQAHGFPDRKLEHLLARCGWWYDAHRASTDVNALIHLLDHRLGDGHTVMKELWRNAMQPTWVVEARGAPFEAKNVLRDRRYCWDPKGKFWWRQIRDMEVLPEQKWLAENVYLEGGEPKVRKVTWRERYAAPPKAA